MSALRMFDVVVLVLAVLRLMQLVEYSPSFQFWSSKVVKSQVDTIPDARDQIVQEPSKVPRSQIDTMRPTAPRSSTLSSKSARFQVGTINALIAYLISKSSKVDRSQVGTMGSLQNGIPPAGMPFCYCEKTSRAYIGTSRLYGISKISIRGSHPVSHLCRSRHAPADTMRSATRARSCVSSKSARFQVDTIGPPPSNTSPKSSKVVKSQVDTIRQDSRGGPGQSSKVARSQVDTIRSSYWKAGCSSLKVDRPQVDTNESSAIPVSLKVSRFQVDTIVSAYAQCTVGSRRRSDSRLIQSRRRAVRVPPRFSVGQVPG